MGGGEGVCTPHTLPLDPPLDLEYLVYWDYQQNYGAGICPHFLESADCFDYRIKIHVLVELNYPKVKLKCLKIFFILGGLFAPGSQELSE